MEENEKIEILENTISYYEERIVQLNKYVFELEKENENLNNRIVTLMQSKINTVLNSIPEQLITNIIEKDEETFHVKHNRVKKYLN